MASNTIILVDLIEEVVDSMRSTGSITSASEVTPGNYILTSSNTLKDKEVIGIDGVNYVVDNVSSGSFSISGEAGIDFVGKSWKALAPYFIQGVYDEIVQRLNRKNNNNFVFQKFPLIAFIHTKKGQSHKADMSGEYATANITLAFVNFTKRDLYAEDRYDYNYRNVLYPNYYSFLKQIAGSGKFRTSGNNVFDHDLIEDLYYGTNSERGNTAHKFNEPLDALVINNTRLIVNDKRCNFLNN